MNASNQSSQAGSPSTDSLRDDVSALIDGELDAASVDRTIDALLASDDLVAFWTDAHRAGDWLRSDEVVETGDGDALLRRLSARLADEPTVLAPRPTRASGRTPAAIATRRFWLRTGLPGASIAAALVIVAWVASPGLHHGDGAGDGTADRMASVGAVAPVATRKVDVERLSDYFAAHRDVTPFGYRGASARPASFSPATAANATP